MQGKWMFAAGALVVLGLPVVGFFALSRSQVAPAGSAAAPLPAVSVAVPDITLTGTIQATRVVNVPVPVDGIIDQFLADKGQHVSEGEVLARIRNPRLSAAEQAAKVEAQQAQNHLSQLESALLAARLEVSRSEADAVRVRSELGLAGKTLERQRTMFREGVTSRLAYEKAEREYNSLKAESEKLAETAQRAADRLDSTTKELDPARRLLAQKTSDLEDAQAESAMGEVNSLADGLVIARRGKRGEPVTTAISNLFQIDADPGALEAVAGIEPQVAIRIHPGQAVAIQIDDLHAAAAGTIREVKSGQVFIDLKDPAPATVPGMTVRIKLP